MMARAAVVRPDGATEISDVEIGQPEKGEVLVEIAATGICHTDMVMRDGGLPVPRPVVLGHEGAGRILKCGEGVSHLNVGDPVVLSFASCGYCPSCTKNRPAYCHAFFPHNFAGARLDGTTALSDASGPIHSHIFGQSSFATHAICPARNVVKAPTDLPLERLGPLGCGIQTGVGAILNTLHVESGASVAVIGLGAVGLSAVMGAKIAGAGPIAAFDRIQSRVAMAEEFGASCAIEITGELSETAEAANLSDFDYIIDTTGVTEVLQQAVGLLAPKGALALVAAYAPEPKLWIDPSYIMSGGRRVIGVVEGDSDPQTFIPKLIEHHREGRLPFDRMIQYYPFDRILDAISDGETGKTIKPVIRMQ